VAINLDKSDLGMIRAAAQGLSGPEVEQFIEAVRAELEAISRAGIDPTKNHVRAACTKVLARGK
jgi:hypothetical protein